MTITERIQQEANKKGLSLKALEKNVGIGNGTIKRWEKSSPQCNKIELVANYLQVSIEWLITGKEPNNISEEEKEMLKAYQAASPEIKIAVNKLLDIQPAVESSTFKIG